MQLDLFVRTDCLIIRLIGVIFPQKQLWPRQTELIDALLDISHHKYIRPAKPFLRHGLQEGLLHQVAVLILIHQHLVELTAEFIRRLRIFCFPILQPDQNLQSFMLQIIEIHQVALPLLLLIAPGKLLCQIQKRLHRLPCLGQVQKHFLRRCKADQLLHFRDCLFCTVPAIRHICLLFRIRLLAAHRCQPRPGHRRQAAVQIRKAFRQSNTLQLSHILIQHRSIGI